MNELLFHLKYSITPDRVALITTLKYFKLQYAELGISNSVKWKYLESSWAQGSLLKFVSTFCLVIHRNSHF